MIRHRPPSPYLTAEARDGTNKAARVVTLSGFASDNPLRQLGDINVYVPSKSYGHVEVTHLAVLHGMLDAIVAAYGAPPRTDPR